MPVSSREGFLVLEDPISRSAFQLEIKVGYSRKSCVIPRGLYRRMYCSPTLSPGLHHEATNVIFCFFLWVSCFLFREFALEPPRTRRLTADRLSTLKQECQSIPWSLELKTCVTQVSHTTSVMPWYSLNMLLCHHESMDGSKTAGKLRMETPVNAPWKFVRLTWAQGEGAAVVGSSPSPGFIHCVSYKFSNSWVENKGYVVHDQDREVE